MTEFPVGGLANGKTTGSVTAIDPCGKGEITKSYEWRDIIHAVHDEFQNQAYNEVRENKQNQWHVQGYWKKSPESPVASGSFYEMTFDQSLEVYMDLAGRTAGSDRVDFDNPYPADGVSGTNSGTVSGSFSVSISASPLPFISLGTSLSLGYGLSGGDEVSYTESKGGPASPYWDIPLGTEIENPKSGDSAGVFIDVKCFSDYDSNLYEEISVATQPTFIFYKNRGLTCPGEYWPYAKTIQATYSQPSFIVGPP